MTETRQSIHGQWSSRWAFILAATGSAVGLGNIWKFPYITGENGGGAFVLIYLLCIAVVGIPVMMSEIMLGRRGKQSPIHTMRTLAQEAHSGNHWQIVSDPLRLQCHCGLGALLCGLRSQRQFQWNQCGSV